MSKVKNIDRPHENNDTSAIIDNLHEYLRYWKWFVLSIGICLVIGIVMVLITPKQYKPFLSVLLNEDKGRGKNSTELDLEALGLLSTINNIENEISILTSPDLMSRVVDSMNLQTFYYIDGKFKKREIYDESPFRVEHKVKDNSLFGKLIFSIEKLGSDFYIRGIYISSQGYKLKIERRSQTFPLNIEIAPDSLFVKVLLTDKNFKEQNKFFVEIQNISQATAGLCSNLSVTQVNKNSSILNLSLVVNHTSKGVAVLKGLINQYNEMNVKINNEIAHNTVLFINDRLAEISGELGMAEDQIVEYKQGKKTTGLEAEAIVYVQEKEQNQRELSEAETQLSIIKMIESFVYDPANKYHIIPNMHISDVTLSKVITEYNYKLLNNELLLKDMGDRNPIKIRLVEDINNMHLNILAALKNVKNAGEIYKEDHQKKFNSSQSQMLSIPQKEKELMEKVRQQKIKEDLFIFLMQKHEETSLSIASTAQKARIISSMQLNASPIAPKPKITLMGTFIIGLLTPVIIIYIINLLRTCIKSNAELERIADAAIIGEICEKEKSRHIVINSDEDHILSELFRTLRNNISLIMQQPSDKIILVTSSISGEGKTFVSINLAFSYTLTGKKVLLVDADFRNSQVKEYLNLDQSNQGLADYISDDNISWKDLVYEGIKQTKLSIMTSGTTLLHPNELLLHYKVRDFLQEARLIYDIIIIDTTSLLVVSDTYLLNEFSDLTLYVVRENITPKSVVLSFVNIQKQDNKLNNMYLVNNATSLKNNYKYRYIKEFKYGYK